MNPKYPFILQFSERKTLEQMDLELLDHRRSFRGYMAYVFSLVNYLFRKMQLQSSFINFIIMNAVLMQSKICMTFFVSKMTLHLTISNPYGQGGGQNVVQSKIQQLCPGKDLIQIKRNQCMNAFQSYYTEKQNLLKFVWKLINRQMIYIYIATE